MSAGDRVMARVVNRVWLECGEAPGIIIDGMLKIEFNTRDVVKARRVLEKLVEFLAKEIDANECEIKKIER